MFELCFTSHFIDVVMMPPQTRRLRDTTIKVCKCQTMSYCYGPTTSAFNVCFYVILTL